MKVWEINGNRGLINEVAKDVGKEKEREKVSFGDTIKGFLEAVNEAQENSMEKVSSVIRGESDDLTGAMVSLEEARLSFNLMLEIRNRLIEAYKEIERMQV
ncbi:MAG: flagellar hook-basal body complex protein FliE [Candidatus Marinimicrobia bacterium]|nr:flagellar hook-basal body complex protein FliE [Candidatus Neomarinimicrobiota bacterium]